MQLSFAKYEGLANDFVIVDAAAVGPALSPALAVRICDRHLGVGADGVLLLGHTNDRAQMKVLNADGSIPEMCGNGIRCVALHLSRTGRTSTASFEIDTDAGPHICRVLQAGPSSLVEVLTRAPSLAPADVPVVADAPVIDAAFELGERTLLVTAVSMGNPHAVTFEDVGEQRRTLGPLLQSHPRFPHRANAGFARLVAPNVIELTVLERGVGWTRACGTGACAAAVAAVETGRAPRHEPIEVRLSGGSLAIVVGDAGQRLSMTGPARHVFDGTIEL